MARNTKYDWPDDERLQALLDEHGTVEVARQVGCPPRSLSNRIRRRGLRDPKQRREPDAANGNGKPGSRGVEWEAGSRELEWGAGGCGLKWGARRGLGRRA